MAERGPRPAIAYVSCALSKPTVSLGVTSAVVSSCGHDSGQIEQRVAHELVGHWATHAGPAERPPHRHPPHAQPLAPVRQHHGQRPRLTPRGCTDQKQLPRSLRRNALPPHFPLNFGSQTASKAGFSLPMPLFVQLSMWRGTINNLRNGQQPLDFTPYKQATKRFWASHLAESRVPVKRINRSLLMCHEYVAGTLVELNEI